MEVDYSFVRRDGMQRKETNEDEKNVTEKDDDATFGPNEVSLRTHSTVNMVVKMRLRSLRISMNSRGAP